MRENADQNNSEYGHFLRCTKWIIPNNWVWLIWVIIIILSGSLTWFRLRSTFLKLILKGELLKQKLNNGKEVKSSKNWRKILTKLEKFWKNISRTNHYKLFKENSFTLHARKYMVKKKGIHGLFRKDTFYICILAGVNIYFFTINFKKINFVNSRFVFVIFSFAWERK